MDEARRRRSDRGPPDEREDTRGPGERSSSEVAGPLLSSAQFDSLVRALGLKKRSQVKLLSDVLSSLREQDGQFRRAFLATARSKTERWLRGIGNNPGRLAAEIVRLGGEATVAGLETAAQEHEGLAMLLFNFAELVAPQGQGAERIGDPAPIKRSSARRRRCSRFATPPAVQKRTSARRSGVPRAIVAKATRRLEA